MQESHWRGYWLGACALGTGSRYGHSFAWPQIRLCAVCSGPSFHNLIRFPDWLCSVVWGVWCLHSAAGVLPEMCGGLYSPCLYQGKHHLRWMHPCSSALWCCKWGWEWDGWDGFSGWKEVLTTRAGPQSQKWSDQQIMLNPTGSIHKKAREKKFDPKKVDFD